MYAKLITHLLAMGASVLAFIGAFLPLLNKGSQQVTVAVLPWTCWVLYLLPPVILVIGFLAMVGQVQQISRYYLPLGATGFFASIWALYRGREILMATTGESATFDLAFAAGGVVLWLAYLGIAFLPFIRALQKQPIPGGPLSQVSEDS